MSLALQTISGQEIARHIEALGQFRIDIFRDYPYLYEGEMQYERDYLARYSQCNQSLLLLAEDSAGVAAACTAIPLLTETEDFRAPFTKAEQEEFFYIGEVMVRSDYRHQGMGSQMLAKMINLIEQQGFRKICLYTVDRGQNHPTKPADYFPPDRLWQKFNFTTNGQQVHFSWKDIGDAQASRKPMNVWVRSADQAH